MEKNQDLSEREIGNYVIPLYAFVKKSIFTFPQDKGKSCGTCFFWQWNGIY